MWIVTRRWSCISARPRRSSGGSPTTSAPASTPSGVVTYIIDRNVNYTNVCVARCNFCAFYRPVGSAEGYVLGFEEIFRKIDETIALGGGQLLLQGGHNPDLPLRVVRGSVPRGEAALSDVPSCTRCRRPRSSTSRGCRSCRCRRSIERLIDGRPRQHSGRRRRDPRRSRAQAPELLRQGDGRRVARRDAAARTAPGCARPRR